MMTQATFEKLKLFIQIGFAAGCMLQFLRVVYIKNTSQEQRKEILFWADLAILWMEKVHNESGQGALKKAEVVKFLKRFGFMISEEQLGTLIDLIVDGYNKNGWRDFLTTPESVLS